MSVSLFDPFADLGRLRHQIDRLVDESARPARAPETGRVWRPAVDLFESEEAFTLQVELPGVNRETLDVQLTGDELIVRGERKPAIPEKSTCVHAERLYGQFQRSFKIGVPVQADAVDATYRDGVLTVQVPKAQSVKPRRIAVKTDAD
ncbi:MAG: heat shock protein Hsp20 [Armatimonadetes bacterium]|jgi:HSP20 family protein|nr:heat shock protein Hsp20 [Armatimonadota bacterium]